MNAENCTLEEFTANYLLTMFSSLTDWQHQEITDLLKKMLPNLDWEVMIDELSDEAKTQFSYCISSCFYTIFCTNSFKQMYEG